MSVTNLYITSHASAADINAGSTVGAAQTAPATGGSWVNATNTYVAPSGTPFAATIVGDYVSIYPDGNTVTGYSAQVTTVVSNVSVILSATIKYGTSPTDGAANRSAVAGGAWATEQVIAAGGLATTTMPQPTKIYTNKSLTITANRTISMVGTAVNPLDIIGYNTTPGDLDSDTSDTLAIPVWTISATFALTFSGTQQLWSNISIVGNRSGTICQFSGAIQFARRMRWENTSANAAAVACTVSSSITTTLSDCWGKCPTTATTTGVFDLRGVNCTVINTVAEGGGVAGFNCGGGASTFTGCVCRSNTGAGILASTGAIRVFRTTIYGATVDCIKWTSTPAGGASVISCILSGLNSSTATPNGVNNGLGTNVNNVYRSDNIYYNVTNPEVGFGDSPDWYRQTDSNPIVTSATDMTPVSGSKALGSSLPLILENQTYINYGARGAVTPVSSGGFTGIIGGGF